MKILTRWLAAATAATLLAGCAGLNTLRSDVSTFGEWPSGRKPGTYAFERLPSQAAAGDKHQALEDAARGALEAAGFTAPAAGTEPDVLVQVGGRITRTDASPWDDPLWWRGGFGYWRHGPWAGPRWGMYGMMDSPRYEREVAVLIRDRVSGKPLYEARASSDGSTTGGLTVLRAMFGAALKDFPATGINPRPVTTPLTD
jgi:Domain of unknown function (DUF4136)